MNKKIIIIITTTRKQGKNPLYRNGPVFGATDALDLSFTLLACFGTIGKWQSFENVKRAT